MPKKTAHSRNTAQRNKPRAQKSVELVRQTSAGKEVEVESSPEPAKAGVTTPAATSPASVNESKDAKTVAAPTAVNEDESTKAIATHNASASERLAARRQAAQKAQRSSVSLITAEHYGYVRKDLIYIAILAIIMFAVIIGLHFVPAIGG
jgi:thiol:disulfide interchange protein